jgi:ABC-type Fe3+ transport system permease subunit
MRRAAWLCGAALVGAGVALLAYFVALLAWQFGPGQGELLGAVLQQVDRWLRPAGLLTALHFGMALAVLGVVLSALGVFIARHEAERIGEEARRAQDRLRRVPLYREEARREPFIGPGYPPVREAQRVTARQR